MRARRHGYQASSEARHRSRHREHHGRGSGHPAQDETDSRSFGKKLPGFVSNHLRVLRIEHRVLPFNDEHIELVVDTGDARVPFVEFQYTLRKKARTKITDFLRAALLRASKTFPRVYLEISARGLGLKDVGEAVARAIREIVTHLHRYEPENGNIIGLRLQIGERVRTNLRPIHLFGMIGTQARSFLEGLLPAPAKAATEPTRPPHFERTLLLLRYPLVAAVRSVLSQVREELPGFVPHAVPAYAHAQTRRPIRQPR